MAEIASVGYRRTFSISAVPAHLATASHSGRTAYEGAIQLLRRVREVVRRLGREEEYREYLAELRETHRRKRSFFGLLDAARLA